MECKTCGFELPLGFPYNRCALCIGEKTMPHDTVEIPVGFLKALYEIDCVFDLRDALKKNFVEMFSEPKPTTLKPGMMFTFRDGFGRTPRMAISRKGEFYFINLSEGCMGGDQEGDEMPRPSLYRPMLNGIIEIKVKDGKVAGARVKED